MSTREWLLESIHAWCQARGYSLTRGARMLGLSPNTVRRLAKGKKAIKPQTILKLHQGGVALPMAFLGKLPGSPWYSRR